MADWKEALEELELGYAAKGSEGLAHTIRAYIEGLEARLAEADRRVGEQFAVAQRADANALRHAHERLSVQCRAEAAEARVRELLACAPGGHSCEEFHHAKNDRHQPGEVCPPQERWRAAIDAALAGKDSDHD